jgi:type IV pilus assembly protein PilM
MKKILQSLIGKNKSEALLSVDVGTSSIKVMLIDHSNEKPALIAVGSTPTPAGAVSNNVIQNPEAVGKAIRAALNANDIQAQSAAISIPGTCVFSKKVFTNFPTLKDLAANIQFEASNYIPHNLDAVYFDYQVIGKNDKGEIEVLLVAAKREVVDSYLNALRVAGLEVSIVDVDYFALENMFQLNYPEDVDKTVAVVNLGARFTGVNILSGGRSLFTGDIGVGGRLYTDALCETLRLEPRQAELAKAGQLPAGVDANVLMETLDRTTEHVAGEIQRQLGLLWGAAATEKAIEKIYVCGGAAQVPGLVNALTAKTGVCCQLLETLRGIGCGEDFDPTYLQKISSMLGVSVGLASRKLGDKQHAIS